MIVTSLLPLVPEPSLSVIRAVRLVVSGSSLELLNCIACNKAPTAVSLAAAAEKLIFRLLLPVPSRVPSIVPIVVPLYLTSEPTTVIRPKSAMLNVSLSVKFA